MAPLSRLGGQIQEVVESLGRIGASSALIGGLALAPHGVIRATRDVDLLVDKSHADAVDRELQALGYRCVHRSEDAGNYLRGDERVDLLYARRPLARRLLESAEPRSTPFGELRVVSVEGLIAFKLQGLINDSSHTQDSPDISDDPAPPVLVVAKGGMHTAVEAGTDWFAALDDLMAVVEALCPRWPDRDNFGPMLHLRL